MFLKQSIRSNTDNREGLKIVYDDVAPYAKENSNPQIYLAGLRPKNGLKPSNGLHPRDTNIVKEFLDLKRDDVTYPGYALCLPGFSLLNGQYKNWQEPALPYGYISNEVSDSTGAFGYSTSKNGLKPRQGLKSSNFLFPSASNSDNVGMPILTVRFNQKFTSVGIFLTFNTLSGDYASRVRVTWYSGSQVLSDVEYLPDAVTYFCNNYVQLYDRITITFIRTSKPFRPIFLTRIDYGLYRDFMSDEINDASCLQEINAISENISINTMNFTIRAKNSVPFDLQKKQRLRLFFNDELLGNFYLKHGAKKAKDVYYLDSHDAIGLLDGNEFAGGIYTGQTVSSVIEQIFEGEDFNYYLHEQFNTVRLNGYIPYTTKKNALVLIAFAIGAVVDTSNYDGIIIYPKQEEASGSFDETDSFRGITLEHADVVTGVRLTVHEYKKEDEISEIFNGSLNGTGEVVFSEPYHSLTISGGTIVSSKDNVAIIRGTGTNVILSGKKYLHSTRVVTRENPDIFFNKNIKEVTNATLVHSNNAQSVLDRVYEYYQRAENVVGDFILRDKKLGQVVDVTTGYDGIKIGTIESIDYDFTTEIKARVIIHE